MFSQTREAVRGMFTDIVKGACFGDRRAMEIICARHAISDFGCYEVAMELFNEKCFSVSEVRSCYQLSYCTVVTYVTKCV